MTRKVDLIDEDGSLAPDGSIPAERLLIISELRRIARLWPVVPLACFFSKIENSLTPLPHPPIINPTAKDYYNSSHNSRVNNVVLSLGDNSLQQ